MWTDRQMDVGHINLIGGLVTHNPPKNVQYCFQITYLQCTALTIHKNNVDTCR